MPDHLSVRDHAEGILTSTRTLNRVQSESEPTLTHEERPRPLDTSARPCLARFCLSGWLTCCYPLGCRPRSSAGRARVARNPGLQSTSPKPGPTGAPFCLLKKTAFTECCYVVAKSYSESEQDRQILACILGRRQKLTRKMLEGVNATERIKCVLEMGWRTALHRGWGIREGLWEEMTSSSPRPDHPAHRICGGAHPQGHESVSADAQLPLAILFSLTPGSLRPFPPRSSPKMPRIPYWDKDSSEGFGWGITTL